MYIKGCAIYIICDNIGFVVLMMCNLTIPSILQKTNYGVHAYISLRDEAG